MVFYFPCFIYGMCCTSLIFVVNVSGIFRTSKHACPNLTGKCMHVRLTVHNNLHSKRCLMMHAVWTCSCEVVGDADGNSILLITSEQMSHQQLQIYFQSTIQALEKIKRWKTHSYFTIGSRILLLFQGLPSLVKLGHQRIIKINNLKARHIGTAILDFG